MQLRIKQKLWGKERMVQLVVFINLFFIPALPLYMIYRKKRQPLIFSLDLLFQYCIVAACNIPLAKVFVFLAKKVGKITVSIDSGYYTLAALASAVLVYLLYVYQRAKLVEMLCKAWKKLYTYCREQYVYYTTYFKKAFWKKKIGEKGIKQILGELAPAYILIFASYFMMLIFEPILLYATNMNDFWFDFRIMIWPVLSVFACFLLIGILIVSAIYFLNLFFSGRVILYRLITLAEFIMFFLLYLQGNWLAGNLPPLTGEEIMWESYGDFENSVLKWTFIILCAATIILIWRFKLGRTVRYTAMGAGVVSIMLVTSLIPTVVENEALKSKDTFSPTLKNFNTVSSNRNFLIFLIDTTDSKMCYDVMMNDADFCGMMEDFTYYPDALSVFPHTRDSIPNILTGAVNHNETSFLDYCSDAYNQSPLFEKLKENEYDINLYSSSIAWGGERNYDIENSTSIYDIDIDLCNFIEEELKYIKFKYLPYELKQYSGIETLDFNACKIMGVEEPWYTWGNWENYARIQENSILDKQDRNYFHFIHCEGVHTPYNMDKDLSGVTEGTQDQKIAASLTMIKAYLQRLKDNDAYDDSVIVIMSDHGNIYTMEDYEQPYLFLRRCNPILFIKGINERHEMFESDCPVSYVDLQGAFCDLIDGKQSTELFRDIEQGRTRTVLWHIWTEEYHMVEYSTTGTARKPRSFTPTGNVYDLKE